ncbi:MAG: site-2 protease family protein [Tepidisphaeraceae bacterium]
MFGHLFIQELQSDPPFFFATIITVVISVTLHELAHGVAAIKLGDDTPIYTGHMTLNPLVHMGGISLILLAVAGIAFGAMPVDRTRMRGKYADAIVAVAGPLTNILLSLLALTGLALWERFSHLPYAQWSPAMANGKYLLLVFGYTNLLLAMFNLLPLPPLDGFWIASNLIPSYRRLLSNDTARGVMTALFFAVFIGAGTLLNKVASPATFNYLKVVSGRSELHFDIIAARKTVEWNAEDGGD